MPLLAQGKLQNIYDGLDRWLTAELTTKTGLMVRAHGVRRFVPPVDDPWVEAHYDFLGMQSQFLRQAGGTRDTGRFPGYDDAVYATERRGQLQLNLFQRARFFATRYVTAIARDKVVAAFPDGTVIPIYDVASGGDTGAPLAGNIITSDITEHVLDDGLRSGLIQHVVLIDTRYLELYTR